MAARQPAGRRRLDPSLNAAERKRSDGVFHRSFSLGGLVKVEEEVVKQVLVLFGTVRVEVCERRFTSVFLRRMTILPPFGAAFRHRFRHRLIRTEMDAGSIFYFWRIFAIIFITYPKTAGLKRDGKR